MIEYIAHNQIDRDKYDYCIQNSIHTLIYPSSWFLDIETNHNWDILMLNDYNFVLPITYFRLKGSFWKKSILKPYHIQQLGIVSNQPYSNDIHDAFINKLYQFKPKSYNFNYGQTQYLNKENLYLNDNFILDLHKPYEELFQNFSKTRRRWIRKAESNDLTLSDLGDLNTYLKFQKNTLQLSESYRVIRKRKKLIQTLREKNLGEMKGVFHQEELIGILFYTVYRDRIYYMQSATNQKGKQLHATDFALNQIIKEYANQPYILDFEGSMIEGIARYMKSFGSENQPYYSFQAK